jgi:acetaldehyde dehydrogenase/alcohol dehydrogenase
LGSSTGILAFGITKNRRTSSVLSKPSFDHQSTSTAIFKSLIALKTRNGIMFSPHPRAKNCTIEAARIVLEAAVKAGAPEGIIGWIDQPMCGTIQTPFMQLCDLTWLLEGMAWSRPPIPQ